ncbi:MAG: hypothetical protein Q8R92_00850 [Deltaproteobacteria bacterium]|nr:hypothetical protein [Deltaproteobacteria bacterium]
MFLRTAAFGLALALVFAPAPPAVASDTGGTYDQNYQVEQQEEESTWAQAGLGIAAIGADFLYVPAKLIYGALGLTTGSAGWILTGGDGEVADRIFTPSLRGTYVLTPRHLTGEDTIHFVGSERYSTTSTAEADYPPDQQGGMVAGGDSGIVEEQF